MQQKDISWATWPAACLYLVFIGYGLEAHSWWWSLSSGEKASWVQAVGSIAAIVGSFWVAQIPVRAAREDERESRVFDLIKHYTAIDSFARMTGVYCAVQLSAFRNRSAAFQAETYQRRQFFEFQEYRRLFESIRPVDVPHATLMKRIGYLGTFLGRVERALTDGAIALETGRSPTQHMWEYLIENLSDAQQCAEEIRDSCRIGVIDLVGPDGPERFLDEPASAANAGV